MKSLLFLIVCSLWSIAFAQHDHNHQQPADSMEHSQTSAMESMSHSFSRSLPMNRNGSGTGWLPDASPMYGYMHHQNNWMFMLHGNLFLRYNHQDITDDGTRGDSKIDAPNWIMGMAQRPLGMRGLLHFNLMLSADHLIAGGSGYPLLFQSGETYQGRPLVDRQHPHDFFSELSVAYSHKLSEQVDASAYLAFPGEPALGPVAFMHRVSSLPNPDAPLGHHWLDATHVTFGVATLGMRYRQFKLEGSQFTGREPNEDRYGFDKPRFDSQSMRLSWNPAPAWALQGSFAFIKSPEAFEPDEDVHRSTLSAIYSHKLAHPKHAWNSTLAWGNNYINSDHAEYSLLVESALELNPWIIYGRAENIQKSAEELQLTGFDPESKFVISAVTLGGSYRLYSGSHIDLLSGVQGSLFLPEQDLKPIYGDSPLAAEIYLRLTPALMAH